MGYYSNEARRLSGVGSNQSAASSRPTGGGPGYGSLAGAGFWLQIGGSLMQSVGTYYAAKTRQYELKSQALSMEFEKSMAAINAQIAETDAQAILDAGHREVELSGLRYAQVRGAAKVSTGARGVQAGVGSEAETAASIEYAAESDRLTITANAVREANQARRGATEQRNRGLLAGTSARNLRSSASSINAGLAAGTSLIGDAGRIAGQRAYDRRYY